jgi:threonine/homoserine/homoserine lactone efflux protein
MRVTDVLPMTIYCAVMSITPGPNNMMLTASGANFGFSRTFPQILGILAGGFVMTAACCLGLGALFVAWPPAQAGLQVVGALYLAWLAWKLARAHPGAADAPQPMSFGEGLLFQVVNPKGWLKAVTLASAFMPPGLSPGVAALLVSLVGLVVGLPCVCTWALFGVSIRGLLREPAFRRAFNLAMAAALLVLAVLLLR